MAKGIDPRAFLPPIAFAAANARFVSRFPDGADELWSAHVKACRHRIQCHVFENILFIESRMPDGGTAHIYGIEFEDGYVRDLNHVLADRQQQFISFLRGENVKNEMAMGVLHSLFSGHEYACIARATAAYLKLRKSSLDIGVGYFDKNDNYQREAVSAEDWCSHSGKSFDRLGND